MNKPCTEHINDTMVLRAPLRFCSGQGRTGLQCYEIANDLWRGVQPASNVVIITDLPFGRGYRQVDLKSFCSLMLQGLWLKLDSIFLLKYIISRFIFSLLNCPTPQSCGCGAGLRCAHGGGSFIWAPGSGSN